MLLLEALLAMVLKPIHMGTYYGSAQHSLAGTTCTDLEYYWAHLWPIRPDTDTDS